MTSRAENTISIVIPVRNRWSGIVNCLDSLVCQQLTAIFDVIVVDDGSRVEVPEFITQKKYPFEIKFIRQKHSGVSAARNLAFALAGGTVVLFMDSDCILDSRCINNLHKNLDRYSNDHFFQLNIKTKERSLVSKIENYDLSLTQKQFLNDNGEIRWLNTAGFAIRKNIPLHGNKLFDIKALRAQDTYLLFQLSKLFSLPRYLEDCVVYHCSPQSILRYLFKGFRVGFLSQPVHQKIGNANNIYFSYKEKIIIILFVMRDTVVDVSLVPAMYLLRQLFIKSGKLFKVITR